MKWFKLNGRITSEINLMAKNVLNSNLDSLDHKRIAFCSQLEDHYKTSNYESDELVERLSDIDYDKRLNDASLSAAIGAIFGFLLSIVNQMVVRNSDLGIVLKALGNLLEIIILAIVVMCLVLLLIKYSMKLTSYTKLHCEVLEKNLIEQMLAEKMQQVKDQQALNTQAIQIDACTQEENGTLDEKQLAI